MKRILLACMILSFLGMACKKKMCTETCSTDQPELTLKGYQKSEIDTVVLRKYYGRGFDQVLSVTYIYPDSTALADLSANTQVHIAYLNQFDFTMANFNWEVFIPATQQTFRISEIRYDGNTVKEGECPTTECYNTVKSYKLDGVTNNGSDIAISK